MKYKVIFWVAIVFLILSFAVMIFSLGFFNSLIQSQVISESIYTEKNYQQWGFVPGDTGVVIYKNHFFYNFTNTDAYFNNDSKPNLQEMGPFTVFENQQFLNYNISNETDSVKFNKLLFYNSTDELIENQKSTKIKTFNLVLFV